MKTRTLYRIGSLFGSLLLLLTAATHVLAATQINIVVGKQAPQLEQLAATEMSAQFQRLFDAQVSIVGEVPNNAAADAITLLLGSPATNPALKQQIGGDWPKLSDQGLVIQSFQRQGLQGAFVGGETPVATLWAAYELGHQFGIRYLLRRDVYPKEKIEPKFGRFKIVMEPNLKTRTWRTINDFAIGPESWGLSDQRQLLKQLAKLKFNRVMLAVYPWHPFVHYEFGGVKKQTAMLWWGEKYRVDGDTPGRAAFGGAKYFENPDFAGKQTYAEMTAAGQKHMQGIIDSAHELGMSVGVSISPLEFPLEFAKALPGARVGKSLHNLLVSPGADQHPDDQLLKDLVKTKICAYLETYSGVDAFYLTLPEFPEWREHAETAWRQLSSQYDLQDLSLADLVATARKRNLIASGERGAQSVKGNIVLLSFMNSLLNDSELWIGREGERVQPVITAIDPALFSVLDQVLPKQTATLHFIDYTARRVAENRELLGQVPAEKVSSSLILTLADDNVGILPQSAVRRIDSLVSDLQKLGWDGFSTRYWMLAELDPTVYYLSRAAFEADVTARSAHDDLFVGITGSQAASDRLWLAFGHMEAATEIIDKNDIGFTFPVPGMMMKHYRSDPAPPWWDQAIEQYTQSMIELYRSHDAVDLRARKTLYYYAKRSEYVLDYLNAVKEVRAAAIARKEGKNEAAVEHLEIAVESLYNAIDTLGDVAREPSDRGLIAVLNEHAYRPLVAEYERLLEVTERESN